MSKTNDHILKNGITLVLGGARSGKSSFAEKLVRKSNLKPVYLATARAEDDEMSERIELHQERRDQTRFAQRGPKWETVEEPLALVDALNNCCFPGRGVLVDCLTLWVTNLMVAGADVPREITNLVGCLDQLDAPVVFVSNEIGLGIVPDNAMARNFRDYAGSLHQQIAANSGHVYFVAAGLPLVMKSED